MNTIVKIFFMALLALIMISCNEIDGGPKQNDVRTYTATNFDKLEMGDALIVTVRQGSSFSVKAEGDRRNLDDLIIFTDRATLVARYSQNGNRNYSTYVDITLPELNGFSFYGAVQSKVSGFEGKLLNAQLSGASTVTLDVLISEIDMNISGASLLDLTGEGEKLSGTIDGASKLNAFEYTVDTCDISMSGASIGKVTASQYLKANLNGASLLVYRGNPQANIQSTGASQVVHD
jgi:Putative auto-transporter adhesin, head GIN domain